MISLSRHIELLLLEHNCVIVPGLGGFIANTASAVYNNGPEGDKLFMPPYRTIGFNSQLQVNDGLLVQSYMQVYDASYPAAYLQMEKEIEQLNIQLNLFGEYNLEGIGTLHRSLGESIILTSDEAGILTPSLYGTYSFGINSLADVVREREIQHAADQQNIMPIQTEGDFKIEEKAAENAEDEKPVIPIKRKDKKKAPKSGHSYWSEFGIAAAVAAIIFLVWLIPNTVTMNGKQETIIAGAPIAKNEVAERTSACDRPERRTNSTKVQNQGLKAETKANSNTKGTDKTAGKVTDGNQATDLKAEPEVEKNYTIVLASFVSEKNSNYLIANLASQGLDEAKFVRKGKTTRVIYSAYATEQEAVEALLSLREKNEAFKDAWPMKMK